MSGDTDDQMIHRPTLAVGNSKHSLGESGSEKSFGGDTRPS